MIATLAVQHGIELWTLDGHHRTFQEFIPELMLFAEPEVR
jgi:predicted nucleic acid-binding protein